MAKDEDIIEAELVSGSSVIAALNSSEVDIQISTAKRYPRSIKEFQDRATELATYDAETANSMRYELPGFKRKDGTKTDSIEGDSVRLAEVVAHAWKNLRIMTRVIDIGDSFLTAMGQGIDLESNTAVSLEIKRRITDKYGKRYSEEGIKNAANAAMSIAYREVVFRLIPKALIKPISDASIKTALGTMETFTQRRDEAMKWLGARGITEEKVLARLEKKGMEDLGLEDLKRLKGIINAINTGEVKVSEAFPDPAAEEKAAEVNKKAVDALKNTVGKDLGKGGTWPTVKAEDKPKESQSATNSPQPEVVK